MSTEKQITVSLRYGVTLVYMLENMARGDAVQFGVEGYCQG